MDFTEHTVPYGSLLDLSSWWPTPVGEMLEMEDRVIFSWESGHTCL